jgi:hypothetical protein
MKIAVLALSAAVALAGQVPAFSLLPAAVCDEEHDVRQCTVAGPKEWSADERRKIEEAMRRLTAHESVRGILVGVRENGYGGFRRYSTHTEPDETHGRVPTFSPGFVLFRSKVIGITDAFFQTADVTDPLSGYRFGDLILLHELIHAFDDRRASLDGRFTTLTGWAFRNNRWEYNNRVNFSGYKGVVAETLTLYARGQYAEAWARDRAFATTMAFPLPTIQSLVNPGESFADILAHLIVDQRASTYLAPDVVSWFEQKVFPTLADKASRFKATDYPLF